MVVRTLWLVPISSSILTITAYNLPNQPLTKAISSQILNVSALFFALAVYLRHRQIVEYYGNRLKIDSSTWRPYSFGLLIVGFLAALALTLEANFFSSVNQKYGILGKLFAVTGLVYFVGQTAFSYLVQPHMSHPILNHCRLFLCFGGMSAFFWMTLFSKGGSITSSDYNYSVLATLVQGSVQLLVSSMASELWYSYAHVPKLHFSSSKLKHFIQTIILCRILQRIAQYRRRRSSESKVDLNASKTVQS
ncbi:hypothetical protein L596_005525 [Steinernema carpocapsae]|uniref:CWH43-like N-terminal domain-containing protein n=1 Tax=Steinernema carpocapsae TaxID=34508 RepID=A0A4U8UZD5_STECR|nr:hypothetical protein L596_005525 [Steinernema carpocapsae]